MKARVTTDDQRARMRGCLFSEVETADDMTPIYLCNQKRKGSARKPVCVLYERACDGYETFPDRFNN